MCHTVTRGQSPPPPVRCQRKTRDSSGLTRRTPLRSQDAQQPVGITWESASAPSSQGVGAPRAGPCVGSLKPAAAPAFHFPLQCKEALCFLGIKMAFLLYRRVENGPTALFSFLTHRVKSGRCLNTDSHADDTFKKLHGFNKQCS